MNAARWGNHKNVVHLIRTWLIMACLVAVVNGGWLWAGRPTGPDESAADFPKYEYRLLATTRTMTMEKEMNQTAAEGYRFTQVMGGQTAGIGSETVVVMMREKGAPPEEACAYKLLATSKTSTMQKELDQSAREGFRYCGQTVFSTTFGGDEVVLVLERDPRRPNVRYAYRLLATTRTSTMEKELIPQGENGYLIRGLTVGDTAFGGHELLVILEKRRVEDE
ncbi:MAG: hypothetical protein JXQ27_01565 [Acidobacteria bacterium]|nr:hypothetical protein [Acidobacteriota bacterium]